MRLCDDCVHAGICINTTQGNCEDYLSEKLIRPQGEWIIAFHDCTGKYYLCSSCKEGRAVITGEDYASLDEFKFCPHCGAEMKCGAECMDEDAKQASIPYTYNAPQHDWKCGYPDITKGKGDA